MAFKLKSKGEIFGINEELSEFGRPVFEKNLDDGIIAEANRDGTTFVNKNSSEKEKRDSIDHENCHHEQMAQGRLQYTNDSVTWKDTTKSPARVYERVGGMIVNSKTKEAEGSMAFKWEQEARLAEK
jgi:hypothetical protein